MPDSDWLDGGGAGGAVDVHDLAGVEDAWKGLLDLVQAGALVSMGTTSDGGALGITVTVDGRWRRDYFRVADELVAWIAQAIPGVEAARNGSSPSAASRTRSRSRTTR